MESNSDDGSGVWIALIALGLLGYALGWWGKKDVWTGYVYPGTDLDHFYKIGPFANFEDCQQSTINSLRGIGKADSGDYECGSNCKMNSDIGIDVCEETRK